MQRCPDIPAAGSSSREHAEPHSVVILIAGHVPGEQRRRRLHQPVAELLGLPGVDGALGDVHRGRGGGLGRLHPSGAPRPDGVVRRVGGGLQLQGGARGGVQRALLRRPPPGLQRELVHLGEAARLVAGQPGDGLRAVDGVEDVEVQQLADGFGLRSFRFR